MRSRTIEVRDIRLSPVTNLRSANAIVPPPSKPRWLRLKIMGQSPQDRSSVSPR